MGLRWLPLDVVLVVVFAVVGRASHEEGLSVGGVLHTAWPFVLGLLVGWGVVLVRRLPPASWVAGAVLWATTLVGGMLLRTATDAGTALPFVVVATIVTGALLLGTRVLAAVIASR